MLTFTYCLLSFYQVQQKKKKKKFISIVSSFILHKEMAKSVSQKVFRETFQTICAWSRVFYTAEISYVCTPDFYSAVNMQQVGKKDVSDMYQTFLMAY